MAVGTHTQISIHSLKPGIKLSKDVMSNDLVLIKRGTPLSENVISSLKEKFNRGLEFDFYVSNNSDEAKVFELTKKLFQHVDNERYKHVLINPALKKQVRGILESILMDIINEKKIYDFINDYLSADKSENENFGTFLLSHPMNVFVMNVASEISYTKRIDKDYLKASGLSAILHDVALTLDPGSLYSHSREGAEYLRNQISGTELEAILHHHELEDGSGYPDNLTSEEINPLAKMINVTCAFDILMDLDSFEARPELEWIGSKHPTRDVFYTILDLIHLANIGKYDKLSVKKIISFYNQTELLGNPAFISDLRKIPQLCQRKDTAPRTNYKPGSNQLPTLVTCMEPYESCDIIKRLNLGKSFKSPRGSTGLVYANDGPVETRRCDVLTMLLNRVYQNNL